jgi:hypothetical protein
MDEWIFPTCIDIVDGRGYVRLIMSKTTVLLLGRPEMGIQGQLNRPPFKHGEGFKERRKKKEKEVKKREFKPRHKQLPFYFSRVREGGRGVGDYNLFLTRHRQTRI